MTEAWEILSNLWTKQTATMVFWSLACFILGMLSALGLYWLRVKYVVKAAEKKLEVLTDHHTRKSRWLFWR